MTSSPAGWHQDPLRRHQLRYWDGERWTQHVSDAGVVGVDPLHTEPALEPTPEATPEPVAARQSQAGATDPQPEPVARTVYVDAQVKAGFRQRRLFADQHALWFGDDSYGYADLTGVTWWATRVVAGPAHNLEYRIKLWQGKKAKTIAFAGRGDHVRGAYDRAVDAVLRNVGTRLATEVLRTIEDGGRAAVAGVVLSQSGADFGNKHLDWSTPFRLNPYSSQGQPTVDVTVEQGGKQKSIGWYVTTWENATLLPFLLDTLAQRYGSRAQT